MNRWRWLVVVAAILAVMAVPVLRARSTHNRELADLRLRTMNALAVAGLQGKIVATGIDNGGSTGSADCGVHVVVSLSTTKSAQQVAALLATVGPVYEDGATSRIVVVAQEPAATGADTLLDLRCNGSIPFARQHPVR